jgi:primase-polymerase (primpol)-like protein
VWLNRGACQEVMSEISVVQGGSASVWSSGETLEEGAASRYAVLTVYSLQGIPGSGQRIDNTHLLAWFSWPVMFFLLD